MWRRRSKRDLNTEIETFLAERIDQFITQGFSPAEAREEALRRLGIPPQSAARLLYRSAIQRERRMKTREALETIGQDLRYTVRRLRRDHRFAAFAIAILALGIGASTAVYSVTQTLLIRPLPFPDADQLVWIPNNVGVGLSAQTTQVGHFHGLRERSKSYSDIAGYMAFYTSGNRTLAGPTESVRLSSLSVTERFFPMLGVEPVLGRHFSAEESAWQGPRAVMLSHHLWEGRFASSRAIIGQSIVLGTTAYTVVGVLPASFDFGSVFAPGTRIDLFLPYPISKETHANGNTLSIVARLAPGLTVDEAAAELAIIGSQLATDNPDWNRFSPRILTLRDHVSGHLQSTLWTLAGAVTLVMLILCANLSNMLLARATVMHKEMAIRSALGASRWRLWRQTLSESLVLSTSGAALGLAAAWLATRGLANMSGLGLPLLRDVRLDTSAVLFCLILAVTIGVAFGLAPAVQTQDSMVPDALKSADRGSTDGRRGQWLRRSLVVSEIALASLLLVGAGLLMRSFVKVLRVDLGFTPDRLASLRVDPSPEWRSSQEKFLTYVDETLTLVRQIPGVENAGLADRWPLSGNRSWNVRAKGRTYERGSVPEAFVWIVSDGYLDAMGMRVREGRDFTPQDRAGNEDVILINESLARTLWPGVGAIGQFLTADRERRVVGVVGDVRHQALEEDAGLEMYLPLRQTGDFSGVRLVMSTALPPDVIGPSVRAALSGLVPNLPTNQIESMQRLVDRALSPRRFLTLLIGAFALFALTLALVGIYGVVSYTVSHRRAEIAVRLALGATAGHIQRSILQETLVLAGIGVAGGATGSLILAQSMGGLLFGVSSTDLPTFAVMFAVVALAAALGAYLPARRASRIDPASAFRGGAL